MQKKLLLVALAMITAFLNGCGGGEQDKSATSTPVPSNKLGIFGSTTLLPVAQKAVEAFQKRRPEIKVSLTSGGSLSGINALTDGYGDIAMSSRELKKEEKEKLQKKNYSCKSLSSDVIKPV